jgi:hypothetical protein
MSLSCPFGHFGDVTEQRVWHLGIEFGTLLRSLVTGQLSQIALVGTLSGLLAPAG